MPETCPIQVDFYYTFNNTGNDDNVCKNKLDFQ